MKKTLAFAFLAFFTCSLFAQNTFPTTGNVGIGTSNPSHKLHIENGELKIVSTSNVPIQLYSPDTYSGILFSDINGTSRIYYRGDTGTFDIGGSGASGARKKLHVHGGTSIGVGYIGTSVPENGLAIEGNVGIGTANSSYKLDIVSSLDDYKQLRVKSPGSPLIKLSGSYNSGNGAEFWQNPSGDIRFNINSITLGLFIKSNSFVGIGTSSPTEKLDVNGNIKAKNINTDLNSKFHGLTVGVYSGDISGVMSPYTFYSPADSGEKDLVIFGDSDGTNNANLHLRLYDGHLKVGASASPNAQIFNNGNAFFNGNIGIGTSSPTGVLHVKGNGTSGDVLLKMELDGNRSWEFQQVDSGPATGLKLQSISNKPFTLSTTDFILSNSTDDGNGLTFVPGTSSKRGGKITAATSYNHSLELANTGSGRYDFLVDGRIGIGTSNPGSRLEVMATDADRYIRFKAPNGEERFQFYVGSTGNASSLTMYDQDGTSGRIRLSAADGGTSYINGGKVGIGTENPTEKLTVNGKILAEEVRIEADVAPDYVFQKYYTGTSTLKKEYVMPTLEEVEAFTKKYHHLPEVPSAKEIQKEGLHLKQITTLLLQKVEELTLYTIEQEKRIKQLEQQLAKDKK